MHSPPPPNTLSVVPSEDRPEGRRIGAQGHPKASWQGGEGWGVPLKPHTLPLIEYAVVHSMFNAMLLFWQQPLWKSIFHKKKKKRKNDNAHKTISLTGRASTEVCKTVKVYVNNEINTYVSF